MGTCNRCGAALGQARDGFYRGLYYCRDFCISLGVSDEEAERRRKERVASQESERA